MIPLEVEHEHYSVDYPDAQSTIQDPELSADREVVKPPSKEPV